MDFADPATPLKGNAAAGLDTLLAGLGITGTGTRDTIEQVVTGALAARGFDSAAVTSVRYGTVTVSCPPQAAALLRYDTGHILSEVNEVLDEPVRDLKVRIDHAA